MNSPVRAILKSELEREKTIAENRSVRFYCPKTTTSISVTTTINPTPDIIGLRRSSLALGQPGRIPAMAIKLIMMRAESTMGVFL
jgi:hypothetical protein